MLNSAEKNRFRVISTLLLTIALINQLSELLSISSVQARGSMPQTQESDVIFTRSEALPRRESEVAGIIQEIIFPDSEDSSFKVVQQPDHDSSFVSENEGELTQFGVATEYGTFGILAHNHLAGEHFFDLEPGQTIGIVLASGEERTFEVTEVADYQKVPGPSWRGSTFHPLDDKGNDLSAQELFETYFNRPDSLVFQTCITKDGNSDWGRYFVIAIETTVSSTPTQLLQ